MRNFLKISSLFLLVCAIFSCSTVSAHAPNEASVATLSTSVDAFAPYDEPSANSQQYGTVATTSSIKNMKVYPGGIPFGVKFLTDGVIVVGIGDVNTKNGSVSPAADAGIRLNDVIIKVSGKNITGARMLTDAAESCGGKPITITILREGKQINVSLTPAYCKDESRYKTGMFVRDSGAGIGTVTYIIPETLSFGGLGHGICDGSSGKLVPMQRGTVVDVTINGVVKGLSGAPGEVKGYFSSGKTGSLLKNTHNGVFGALAALPRNITSQPISVATRGEVREGEAYILSTLDGTTPQKYKIEISDIKLSSTTNKCFTVKVTDPALLSKSGGIVQGMSGSPIIQNGKLVGAVTHVLINDPTTGYGIFIENMLNASQQGVQPKAA